MEKVGISYCISILYDAYLCFEYSRILIMDEVEK